ncbi:hypothetical protein B0T18DRAFT_330194 [Schizothecium vesticola]|uniref:Uncharacterized protein n=1 Tax=Schizothecium vesticola TaxID=314040 RepID=A0AA40K2B0_9PEZI|nr:hypothetical protein B0T18DRAFT_330194 [Schizothecium vesticola]
MQFSQFLFAFTAFSGLTSAACFTGGLTWPNWAQWPNGRQPTFDAIEEACRETLAGRYTTQQTRYRCIPGINNQKFDFTLKLISPGSRVISATECISGMTKEMACKHGGRTRYGNWEYTADPNAGRC